MTESDELHWLENDWSFWVDRKDSPNFSGLVNGLGSSASNGVSQQDWESSITPLGCFGTIETFWKYMNVLNIDSLPPCYTVRLFKNGIKPSWEDDANCGGGQFSVSISRGDVKETWKKLVLSIVGESFGLCEELTGATLTLKGFKKPCLIRIWIKCSHNQSTVQKLKSNIDKILELEPSQLIFSPHDHNNTSPCTCITKSISVKSPRLSISHESSLRSQKPSSPPNTTIHQPKPQYDSKKHAALTNGRANVNGGDHYLNGNKNMNGSGDQNLKAKIPATEAKHETELTKENGGQRMSRDEVRTKENENEEKDWGDYSSESDEGEPVSTPTTISLNNTPTKNNTTTSVAVTPISTNVSISSTPKTTTQAADDDEGGIDWGDYESDEEESGNRIVYKNIVVSDGRPSGSNTESAPNSPVLNKIPLKDTWRSSTPNFKREKHSLATSGSWDSPHNSYEGQNLPSFKKPLSKSGPSNTVKSARGRPSTPSGLGSKQNSRRDNGTPGREASGNGNRTRGGRGGRSNNNNRDDGNGNSNGNARGARGEGRNEGRPSNTVKESNSKDNVVAPWAHLVKGSKEEEMEKERKRKENHLDRLKQQLEDLQVKQREERERNRQEKEEEQRRAQEERRRRDDRRRQREELEKEQQSREEQEDQGGDNEENTPAQQDEEVNEVIENGVDENTETIETVEEEEKQEEAEEQAQLQTEEVEPEQQQESVEAASEVVSEVVSGVVSKEIKESETVTPQEEVAKPIASVTSNKSTDHEKNKQTNTPVVKGDRNSKPQPIVTQVTKQPEKAEDEDEAEEDEEEDEGEEEQEEQVVEQKSVVAKAKPKGGVAPKKPVVKANTATIVGRGRIRKGGRENRTVKKRNNSFAPLMRMLTKGKNLAIISGLAVLLVLVLLGIFYAPDAQV